MDKNGNTGFYIIITVSIVAVVGIWAYNNYLKSKVEVVSKTGSFFGLF